MSTPVNKLTQGHKYRVRFLPHGCRKPREMVAVFMDREARTLHWHGEEVFGHTALRCDTGWNQLISVLPVESVLRCQGPRPVTV